MSLPIGLLALGWTGQAVGLLGLAAYVVVVLRRPDAVRVLNGSGLLLSSLALTQARAMVGAARGPQAFSIQAAVALMILAVVAQATAGLRNRRAWDGGERRRPAVWDGADRRARRAGGTGEEHA